MPVNREPRLYQGYVISQIGTTAGEEVEMELKNAQACVACGTHRWADDPTDLSNVHRVDMEQKAIADAAAVEADRLHNLEMRRIREEQEVSALKANKTPFDVASLIIYQEGEQTYLANPFPSRMALAEDFLELPPVSIIDADGEEGSGVREGDVVIALENGLARYRVVATATDDEGFKILVVELVEDASPQVDIPADWRELGHLQQIPLAKAIRGVKGGINKAQAIAILEEWTKPNDPVRIEIAVKADEGEKETQPKAGEGQDAGNRDQRPFLDAGGNPVSPEEKTRQDAQRFASGDDDFGV